MSAFAFYLGVFLTTACTLMLQVVQTRILSVVAWYHLAFFVISMAMFGLTAGAIRVYVGRERFTARSLSRDLAHHATAFAVSLGLCLLIQMTLAPTVVLSVAGVWSWLELALCLAVPFYFAGVVVALALTRAPFPVGRVYGVDLLGAASGCLGVLALLSLADAPSAVLWIAALATVAAIAFARSGIGGDPTPAPPLAGPLRHRGFILVLLAAGAALNGLTYNGVQPLFVKGRFEDGSSHIFREWNTYSRVAVTPEASGGPMMWGWSPRISEHRFRVSQRMLSIDGDAGSVAYRFGGDLAELEYLRYDVTALAYHLPGRERVAIVGVGGGRDILTAALFGARDIVGIEINPTFVRLLTHAPGFSDFTNLGRVPGVTLVVDEGRSWLARTGQRFDVIQMSLADTWAATGAGAFSLSENGLYTVEAWKIFLGRLTDRGVFTVSRWYDAKDPSETGRMLSLAVAALAESGAAVPDRHIFVATAASLATLVVSRQPLSGDDLDALHRATARYQFRDLVTPSAPPQSELLRAIVGARGRDALVAAGARGEFDLTPATDDRPFFFNQLPLHRPLHAIGVARELVGVAHPGGVRAGNLVATGTLVIVFGVSLALVVAAIVVPMRSAIRDVGRRLVFGGTAWFALIGAGFMMVEIGLLQRMGVFLGHPVYSLGVSLFTLIVAAGIGSLLSETVALDRPWKIVVWAGLTAVYVFSLRYWLSGVLLAVDHAPLPLRAAVAVAVIAPAGLSMGFAFPTGMRLVSAVDSRPTPWFWGTNGAAGVLASVVAVGASLALGIGTTLALGALCYLLLIPTVLLGLSPGAVKGKA